MTWLERRSGPEINIAHADRTSMTTQVRILAGGGTPLEEKVNNFCKLVDKDVDTHLKELQFLTPDICVIIYEHDNIDDPDRTKESYDSVPP